MTTQINPRDTGVTSEPFAGEDGTTDQHAASEPHNHSWVWYQNTATATAPLGHTRGARTKALWNGKAYEIVPIVEPEPDPAQMTLDEFIAVRKAKRDASQGQMSLDLPKTQDEAAALDLDRAMKKGTP